MKPRNLLLFIFVAFLWGSNWSAMKLGLCFVPSITFVLQRFIVSATFLLPAFVLLRRRVPRDRHTLIRLLPFCIIFVSIIIAQAIGLTQESSSLGAVLTYTQPLFVFCLAIPFLKEKVTAIRLLGVAVGFAGVVTIFYNKIGSFTLAPTFVLLFGAFLWAVSVVYYKKALSHVDSTITHFLQLFIGIAPLLALNLANNSFIIPSDPLYTWIILYSSIGALATGNVIWLHLLKDEEATILSGSSLIIPAIAMFFGWRLLGESLSLESLVGAVLILSGVCLVNLRRGH